MEKKTISVHAVTVHAYTIIIILLLLVIAILGIKYAHLKWAMNGYMHSTIWMNQQKNSTKNNSDEGLIIAASASQIPEAQLQTYVTALSKELNRDIVIMDTSKKILADTVSANKGTTYTYDGDGEIKMTLTDGKTRSFLEKSADYPNGVNEDILPMKNALGDITGVVLLSNETVSQ